MDFNCVIGYMKPLKHILSLLKFILVTLLKNKNKHVYKLDYIDIFPTFTYFFRLLYLLAISNFWDYFISLLYKYC